MTRGGYPSGVTELLELQDLYGPDDPRVLDMRADNPAAARVADHIARVVAEAPPLSDDQRERLALIIAPARDAVAASRAAAGHDA
jgi:hypothetical protein